MSEVTTSIDHNYPGEVAFGDPEPARAGGDAPAKVSATHSRYPDLVRGKNQRWVGAPEYVCIVTSTEQVVEAVQDAIRSDKRISIRSGGHCYEDFVYNPGVDVVIDMSEMCRVYYDEQHRAFAVEPGAELLDVLP